ncbi:hypothetical protein [Clostridium lacusfryxellense]|uniref:hypothetical protein n=1 Tax=Clostridium lacusfryxellense TaxID=205328 RepID=UPI001C0D7634|nr:hypothetical protein [Clostridium lacusfryxellense]MBU3109954.1 hypothetical protein [Clostridium lacusfryxellense]
MRKMGLIVIVLVITSIAIIFSNNIKPDTQAEGLALNTNVYDFLMIKSNRIDIYEEAIKLNQGSSQNTCVYFIAQLLRENNLKVPTETSNTEQIISLLKEKGFEKQKDYKKLMPGDICFTTDESGNQSGSPSHTYIFMKWVKDGNYDYAYICDNQAKDYEGKIYHIRNINVIAKANGFDKDKFAFFMRKN